MASQVQCLAYLTTASAASGRNTLLMYLPWWNSSSKVEVMHLFCSYQENYNNPIWNSLPLRKLQYLMQSQYVLEGHCLSKALLIWLRLYIMPSNKKETSAFSHHVHVWWISFSFLVVKDCGRGPTITTVHLAACISDILYNLMMNTDHELESALKIGNLKKLLHSSHLHYMSSASLHIQNKEDQTQQLTMMCSACLYCYCIFAQTHVCLEISAFWLSRDRKQLSCTYLS